jgi:glycosyltransferase involved in cell wall biosynthesis
MNRLPISVCIVSGAEALRIKPALESVANWTSELVVVLNAEVTDGTDQVAAGYGAKIHREPWKGFIGQKNSAAEKASQPWLLNLDADERVSPALAQEIASLFRAPNLPHPAYEFPRCTFYCGRWIRHGDWYPDRVRRLWRKGAARWVGEEPHARLEVEGTVGRLRSDLHHYTNESVAQHVQKIVPYNEQFARSRLASGRSAAVTDWVVRPWWRFVRAYILRLGFLDGWQGYYIAWLNAFSVATRCALLEEARMPAPTSPPRNGCCE